MALGANYVTLAQLKVRLGDITDTEDDVLFTAAVDAATEGINHACGRDFQQAAAVTARTYRPTGAILVITHDLFTTTGLVVKTDEDDDGTFETTLDSSAFELEPTDGIVNGQEGWPWWKIRLVDGTLFPRGHRSSVQVTAQWGWAAVPDAITNAAYVLAEDLAKLRDAPFGVGGFAEFGRIRARENPHVAMLINPYRRLGGRLRVA